jgi:hypothetical protein
MADCGFGFDESGPRAIKFPLRFVCQRLQKSRRGSFAETRLPRSLDGRPGELRELCERCRGGLIGERVIFSYLLRSLGKLIERRELAFRRALATDPLGSSRRSLRGVFSAPRYRRALQSLRPRPFF